jgi:hypothetical protein
MAFEKYPRPINEEFSLRSIEAGFFFNLKSKNNSDENYLLLFQGSYVISIIFLNIHIFLIKLYLRNITLIILQSYIRFENN